MEAALARLTAAGITGALPGTRYVAEAIARGRRGVVVANRADLVGGIVVTEATDLPKARTVLETASLGPAMIIPVGSAADLVAAEGEVIDPSMFVVPPSEAVWDRAAAGAERARREERLASLDQQRATLDDRAAGARSLAEALVRHATAYPAGWLSMRVAERDRLSAELGRLNQERAERHSRRTEIATSLNAFRTESVDLRGVARAAEQRVGELQRLFDEEASVASLAATIELQRAEAKNWRSLAEEAARAADAAEEDANGAAAAPQDHRAASERIRQELSKIVLVEPVREPSLHDAREIVAASDDLFELRARFAELDRRLTGEMPASDVAARRKVAIEARELLSATIETHPAAVRERAMLLLTSPDAGELGRPTCRCGARKRGGLRCPFGRADSICRA